VGALFVESTMLGVEVAIVLTLIVVNGALALSELAVVSARRSRLQMLAERGDTGAAAALDLAADPGRFLSTVQIGITLVGVLAGAFSGATLADRLGDYLETFGFQTHIADGVAFGLIVASITYLSLIVGELVPKQIALRDPERVAAVIARPMALIANLAAPLVYVLDASARAGLWLIGSRAKPEQSVTEDEIKLLVAEAAQAGVVEPEEHEMIAGVMRLGDRPVRAIMTPRRDVEWIDLDADPAEIRRRIRATKHTILPAGHGSIDEVAGVILTRDLLDAYLDGREPDPRAQMKTAPVISDQADALEAIGIVKTAPTQIALVADEYGSFEGIVTSADFLEAIAGQFAEARSQGRPACASRDDGSWLVDGAFAVDELAERLGIELPGERDYHTVAGLALYQLRRLPIEGDSFEWAGWTAEVVDMDGRRIDKMSFRRIIQDRHGSGDTTDRTGQGMIWPDRLASLAALTWAVILGAVAIVRFTTDGAQMKSEDVISLAAFFAVPIASLWVILRLIRFLVDRGRNAN
jgi:putative hemolysin